MTQNGLLGRIENKGLIEKLELPNRDFVRRKAGLPPGLQLINAISRLNALKNRPFLDVPKKHG
jgi:hypothetical protein